MFRGRRAWFCRSVGPGPRELWAASGGSLTHWRDAHYLFSSDATHPDTRRIHESLDYMEGRATVFHSQYISAWASTSAEAKLSVVLGHFILPPACLQEVIRGKIGRFIWEQVDDSPKEEDDGFSSILHPYLQPSENLREELQVAGKGSEEEAVEDTPDLASSDKTVSRVPARGKFLYRALQEYPASNMVTGYTSARHMKQYSGELRDFIPGTEGYTAYWIQNISLYPDTKMKTKRKL